MLKTMMMGCAVLLLAVAPAMAQDKDAPMRKGGHGGGLMAAADTDKDGVVTKDEFNALNGKRFDAMDADHDGKITEAELSKHREAMKARHAARKAEKSETVTKTSE